MLLADIPVSTHNVAFAREKLWDTCHELRASQLQDALKHGTKLAAYASKARKACLRQEGRCHAAVATAAAAESGTFADNLCACAGVS